MPNKIWNDLYRLPKVNKPKWRYKTRKAVEKFAERRGATVHWDYYRHGYHRVQIGDGLDAVFGCYNTNEAWDDIDVNTVEPKH